MGIKVGMCGVGSFAQNFIPLFKHHPGVDHVVLCDLDAEKLAANAEKHELSDTCPSLDALCDSDVDAIAIITQHHIHGPQAVQALRAGKHVYSAVPISCIPDGDEILEWCDKLVQTCRRTGRHYMLGETTYYHADAMYCRRRAAEGAFGRFVYGEGEYYHAFDWPTCDLRDVQRVRLASGAGREWPAVLKRYSERGVRAGPMHYPTHSVSGPMCVMNAHAVKVCSWGQNPFTNDAYFGEHGDVFSNETALFHMSNGATMRICEHRECALCRETFRVYGTKGSYENTAWLSHEGKSALTVDEMRDPLPPEVAEAFRAISGKSDFYGGHGGSHVYLVNEFVDAVAHNRRPAINVWEAVRYMAAGVMAHKSALRDGELLDVPDWGDK